MEFYNCCNLITPLPQIFLPTRNFRGEHFFLLPSATKLWRLCFYRCVSVHGGGGIPACLAGVIPACLAAGLRGGCYPSMHCRWYPSMPCNRSPGGAPRGSGPGGACSGGVPAPGVCVETPPPKADGYCCGLFTHPTGMHSCSETIS